MSWIIPMRHRFLTPNLPVSILLRCERRTITNTISSEDFFKKRKKIHINIILV